MIGLTVKERIIKTLLESPKTTGEIAIQLGYKDEKTGYGKYNIIKPDLNTLQSYGFIHKIKSDKKSPGAPATTYDIVYEMSVLRKIIQKYPSLITDLQKSDKVLSLLVDEENFDAYIGVPVDHDPDHFNPSIKTLKDQLSLSQSFFSNYLMRDSSFNTFKKTWQSLTCSDDDGLEGDYRFILFEMFKHSVINDFIKGYGSPNAITLIQNTAFQYSLEYLEGYQEGCEDTLKEVFYTAENEKLPEVEKLK